MNGTNKAGRVSEAKGYQPAASLSDKETKQKALTLLKNTNRFQHIVDIDIEENNQYSIIDITGKTINNINIAYEVKTRCIPSTKYNDHMCEENKITYAKKQIEEGKIDNAYLMTVFTDNKVFISDLTDNYTTKYHYGPKCTDYQNKNIVRHNDCVFKPKWVFTILGNSLVYSKTNADKI